MIKYFRSPVQLEKESIFLAMQKASKFAKGNLLDVGCGEKPYAHLFTGKTTSYLGTDIDLGNAKRVDICADSLRLPVRTSSVDTVVSNQVIEHVKSPELFVKEATRILKPDGILIITAPQLWCLHEKPHDYYRFTRYALEMLCEMNRLKVILLEERYGAFAAIAQMFALMVYLPNSHQRWRTHLSRLLFGPAQTIGVVLDKMFFNPDLTLGYVLVARKSAL